MNNVTQYADALDALGHKSRLSVFRLLVKAGHQGLNVGEIAKHTRLHNSTLAHHIATLANARLVIQTRQGREIITTANYKKIDQLVEFLQHECCQGINQNS